MPVAYILVRSEPGLDTRVEKEMASLPYVNEVSLIDMLGYTFLVRADLPETPDLKELNFEKIRKIDGVADTLPMIATVYTPGINRTYTEDEVKEIFQIHGEYRSWAPNAPIPSQTDYDKARELYDRMQEYPSFFDRELTNLLLVMADLEEHSMIIPK